MFLSDSEAKVRLFSETANFFTKNFQLFYKSLIINKIQRTQFLTILNYEPTESEIRVYNLSKLAPSK